MNIVWEIKMKHTECKDCELSSGDCGYHFKMDGTTNYDIASLSACDKYGNCEFFKAKAKPESKHISREDIQQAINSGYNQAIKDITKYVQDEKKYYTDGTMCSMSESTIGENVCDDILKYLKDKKGGVE